MRSQQFTISVNDDTELTAIVAMTSPGSPGKISGPPEDCYPPESPEFDIEGWLINGKPATEDEVLAIPSEKHIRAIEDEILEMAYADDWSDERDPDDARDQRMDDERWFE